MPINHNRLAQYLLDEWNATGQPIQERGLGLTGGTQQMPLALFNLKNWANALAPVATYEDGSKHLAVPALLKDIGDAYVRARAYDPKTTDPFGPEAAQQAIDAFTVAGASAAGGAAAPRPRNALAREVNPSGPVSARGYHGAVEGIESDLARKKSKGVYWASENPEVASAYADADMARLLLPDRQFGAAMPHVAPVDLTFLNPLHVDASKSNHWNIPFEGQALSTDDIAALAKRRGHDGVVFHAVRNAGRRVTDYAALAPNTVRSATTGETLFSNSKEAALAPTAVNAEPRLAYADPNITPRPDDEQRAWEEMLRELFGPRYPQQPLEEFPRPPLPEPKDDRRRLWFDPLARR